MKIFVTGHPNALAASNVHSLSSIMLGTLNEMFGDSQTSKRLILVGSLPGIEETAAEIATMKKWKVRQYTHAEYDSAKSMYMSLVHDCDAAMIIWTGDEESDIAQIVSELDDQGKAYAVIDPIDLEVEYIEEVEPDNDLFDLGLD